MPPVFARYVFGPFRPLPQPDCYILSSLKFFVNVIRLLNLDKIISMDAHRLKHSAVNSRRLTQNSPLVTMHPEQHMPLFGSALVYLPGQSFSSIPAHLTTEQSILASHRHAKITRRQADSRQNVTRFI